MRILFYFSLNASYKSGEFFKTLLKKDLKFVLYKRDSIVIFNLDLMLLLVKINLITEKQGCKKIVLGIYGIGCVKIVLTLLTKVIILYIRVIII